MAEDTFKSDGNAVRGARALGWFSIGLGAMELFAPRTLGRLIGVDGAHTTLIRAMGAREIAAGIVVLTQKVPTEGMATRVAGDALDLTLLGAGYGSENAEKGKLTTALAMVAGVTALDVYYASRLTKHGANVQSTVQTVAVNRTPQQCYEFWRNFENLPRFMKHVNSVRDLGNGRSHWEARGPGGISIEWDAELTEDSPNRIAWRSLPGADVENSGSVEFQNGTTGHGTIVKALVNYKPPAGAMGSAVAKLFGEEPSIQAKMDLRRFKAVLETGEVPTIKGQSSGRVLSHT